MTIEQIRDEIKLKVTGGILDIELTDANLDKVIQSGLRELQRYICTTNLITLPYKRCIDLSNPQDTNNEHIKVSSVSRIYRALGFVDSTGDNGTGAVDPMQASQWQLIAGTGNLYNFQDYAYNYMSWNTLLQMRNTTSTDLAFWYDKSNDKLYINISSNYPDKITIEYVPRYDTVDEIASDYWIDILIRLCVALTKVTLGRIRSRYTQSNALWQQDGQTLLAEGLQELQLLRDNMQANSQLCYPID